MLKKPDSILPNFAFDNAEDGDYAPSGKSGRVAAVWLPGRFHRRPRREWIAMAAGFEFSYRKDSGQIVRSAHLSGAFTNWSEGKERWLFMAPHDDDIVIGAGLTVLAGLAENVEIHAVITTDGSMGYCDTAERGTIAGVRRRETLESFRLLGVPEENVLFLGYPDCDLNRWCGHRPAKEGDPGVIADYLGLQNGYVYALRKAIPTRVFLPTNADLHPDHILAAREFMICLFHAQGAIWPELGAPIPTVPEVYEYAVYCDFPSPPHIQIRVPDAIFDHKMRGITAYASQKQIGALVSQLRAGGPLEYLREMRFRFYSPLNYAALF